MVDEPTSRVANRIRDKRFNTFTETGVKSAIRKELTTLVVADGTPFSRQLGDKSSDDG